MQAGSLAGELGWAALAMVGLEMMLGDGTLRAALAVLGGVLWWAWGWRLCGTR